MCAITAALTTNLSLGDTLLCANQAYGTTLEFLEGRLAPPGVEVVYLDVTDHAAWDIVCESATKYLNGHPGVTAGVFAGGKEAVARARAFEVKGGRPVGEAFMDNLELCARGTSLGGVYTVVSDPASTSHRQYSEEQLEKTGISPGLLRASIGCENAADNLGDFEQALEPV
jgi:cystathionine beta-lyase/cystathionine gamma-synthase